MIYSFLADLALVAHLAFVLFAALGGLLVLRWRGALWAHLPAFVWGMLAQCANLPCPLTDLESRLRQMGGERVYTRGFVEHYASMILYPENLTVEFRFAVGLALLALNLLIYSLVILQRRRGTRSRWPAQAVRSQ